MQIPRIYTPQALAPGARVALERPAAHYLVKVLRAKTQAPVILFNGDGHDYTGQLVHTRKGMPTVLIAACEKVHTESPLHLTLAQGIARGQRMDYCLQKAVELGVAGIVPLFCERTEVKLDASRLQKRWEHWRGVVISACEQSGRARIPGLFPPRRLGEWLHDSDESALKLILSPQSTQGIKGLDAAKRICLLVGPEGGLSDAELQQAEDAGFERVSLGPRTLRTETAGPAALTALQTLWGDMG